MNDFLSERHATDPADEGLAWGLYSLHQFPFRLQPIFKVVTKKPAMGAVDLVRAIQQFLDLPGFPDCVFMIDSVLQFKLLTNLFL